ncbi:hypothetical protein [Stutzerimonas frequens]|uniref:hypothetical protein n=1 Tax=Stutzerimonas frequens TaxID=2968969 RepID=UPI0012E1C988|nr:hypothetical protein [Stutzerimonas frequens]MUT69974.1 hypothetical protein [Stutzerimonas frequens]
MEKKGIVVELDKILSNFKKELDRTCELIVYVDNWSKKSYAELIDISNGLEAAMRGEHKEGSELVKVPADLVARLTQDTRERAGHIIEMPELTLRMAFVHLVTLFEASLSDLIRAILFSRPSMLKSKRQISYEEVFSVETMSDLVGKVIDREASDLTYGTVDDIFEHIKSKLHVPFELTPEERLEITTAKARRNILVHNQGKVDSKFLRLAPSLNYSLGQQIKISATDCREAQKVFRKVIGSLVDSIERKYAKA